MHTRDKKTWVLTCMLAAIVLVAGCSNDKTVKKDPFFEKWETLAEKSQGFSPPPSPRDRVISIQEVTAGGETRIEEEEKSAPPKPLPKNPVTLRMRQADIKSVLRALARSAGINILIKNEVQEEVTVDFVNVPWDQAFMSLLKTKGLSHEWEGDILRVMSLDDIKQAVDVLAEKEKKRSQILGKPITAVVRIDYADAKSVRDNLQEFLKDKDGKPRGSVKVDEHSNSLIIQATRGDLDRMIPIIERVDKATPQIRIKCNIVETTKEMARALGIQWGGVFHSRVFGGNRDFYVTPGGSGGSAAVPVPPNNPPLTGGYAPSLGSTGVSGQGMGVNFPISNTMITQAGGLGTVGFMLGNIGENMLELQLQALQQDNKIRILSSPTITTLDNQKAFTENGEKVPYSTLDTSVTPPTRTVKFEDAVLRLEITPHVIEGKNLKMKILVKKDEVDMSRTVDGNPFIIKKQTDTVLIVEDGETIVISGLTKQRVTDSDTGIPGLKDTPVLGWLFKKEEKGDKMEEVLIFITPHILPLRTAAASGKAGETGQTEGAVKKQ